MNGFSKWIPLAVFFVAGGIYISSFQAPFQYDDFPGIAHNGFIRNLDNIPRFFTSTTADSRGAFTKMWRPLTMTTFALNWSAGGIDPFTYRIANTIGHGLVALMVYFFFLHIFSIAAYGRWLALAGATLFAVHPLATQTVLLVWKRSGILSALFVLGGLFAFARLSGWKQTVSIALLFSLALMSKEDAIVLPGLLIAFYVLFRDIGDRRSQARSLWVSTAIAAIYAVAWVFWIAVRQTSSSPAPLPPAIAPFDHALMEIVVIWRSWELMFFPYRLNVDHYLHPTLLSRFETWGAVIGLAVACGFAAYLARKNRRVGFAFLMMLIPLTPFLFFHLPIPMDEARAYLPLVGFCLLAAEGAHWMLKGAKQSHFKSVPVVLVCFLSIYAMRTSYRIEIWKDARKLWADSMRKDPRNVRARNGFVFALVESRQGEEARPIAEKTVIIAPSSPTAWLALARVQDALSDPRAEKSYEESIQRDPRSVDALNNLGAWLADQHRWDDAIGKFERALQIDPSYSTARKNLDLARKLRK